MKKLGLQLYSYDNSDVNLSLIDKIKVSKELGYDTVEFAGGYNKYDVDTLKKVLKETSLEAISAHVQLNNLMKDLPFFSELGVSYMICPSAKFNSVEEAKIIADKLNQFGLKASRYGIKTGFHNHTKELYELDGQYLLDYLMDFTDPNYVVLQLDVGHLAAGGVDPVEYIKKYSGRVELVHIKENKGVVKCEKPQSYYDNKPRWNITISKDGQKIFPPEFYEFKAMDDKRKPAMGKGDIDWAAVIKAADEQFNDVKYIIERENSYNNPENRIACILNDRLWISDLIGEKNGK